MKINNYKSFLQAIIDSKNLTDKTSIQETITDCFAFLKKEMLNDKEVKFIINDNSFGSYFSMYDNTIYFSSLYEPKKFYKDISSIIHELRHAVQVYGLMKNETKYTQIQFDETYKYYLDIDKLNYDDVFTENYKDIGNLVNSVLALPYACHISELDAYSYTNKKMLKIYKKIYEMDKTPENLYILRDLNEEYYYNKANLGNLLLKQNLDNIFTVQSKEKFTNLVYMFADKYVTAINENYAENIDETSTKLEKFFNNCDKFLIFFHRNYNPYDLYELISETMKMGDSTEEMEHIKKHGLNEKQIDSMYKKYNDYVVNAKKLYNNFKTDVSKIYYDDLKYKYLLETEFLSIANFALAFNINDKNFLDRLYNREYMYNKDIENCYLSYNNKPIKNKTSTLDNDK